LSSEYEAWSAALLAGFTIPEWFELSPEMRAMIIGYYRAHEAHQAVLEVLRGPKL
jgi:hypothetical protein